MRNAIWGQWCLNRASMMVNCKVVAGIRLKFSYITRHKISMYGQGWRGSESGQGEWQGGEGVMLTFSMCPKSWAQWRERCISSWSRPPPSNHRSARCWDVEALSASQLLPGSVVFRFCSTSFPAPISFFFFLNTKIQFKKKIQNISRYYHHTFHS